MKKLLLIMAACSLWACNVDRLGLIYTRSADVDIRFGQSMEYNAKAGYQSIATHSDSYKIYVVTDIHLSEKETANLDRFVSVFLADETAAPFCICLGDMVNDKGQYGLLESHLTPLTEAGRQLFTTPGNHDIYFGEWNDWAALFHTSCYWFEVVTPGRGKDLFLSLDSAGGTMGKAQADWAEAFLGSVKGQYSHITVFTHTHFWKRDNSQGTTSNYNLEETYALADLFSRTGVDLVLAGHDHATETTFFKGVRYETLESLKMHDVTPGYNIFTFGTAIDRSFVPVE